MAIPKRLTFGVWQADYEDLFIAAYEARERTSQRSRSAVSLIVTPTYWISEGVFGLPVSPQQLRYFSKARRGKALSLRDR